MTTELSSSLLLTMQQLNSTATSEEFLNLKITGIRPQEEVPALLKLHKDIPEVTWMRAVGCIGTRKAKGFMHVYTHYTIFEGRAAKQVLIIN